jgi:hypothetical protein
MKNIYDISERKIQVQVKDPILNKSMSFTVKNNDLEELYNFIFFACKTKEKAGLNEFKIVCYQTKNKEEIMHEEGKGKD